MIFAKLSHLSRYLGISASLDTAIRYLIETDLTALPQGRTDVDGDNVFVKRFSFDTKPDPITEAHLRYIDIHIALSGEEQIGVADISALQEVERREADDFICLSGEFQSNVALRPGYALIVFPEDAHSPMRQLNGVSHVDKIVVKVIA